MEKTKEFLSYIQQNPDFMKSLENLSEEECFDKLKAAGFDFKREDLARIQEEARELSDDELANAAGGGCGEASSDRGGLKTVCRDTCMCEGGDII
jgi:predicted ribosomally synthesized peptide with nif11-like leader